MAAKRDVARVLKKALALMNNQGAHWVKNSFQVPDPDTGEMRYCSVGAVNKAVGLYDGSDSDHEALTKRYVLRDAALTELARGLPTPKWTESYPKDEVEPRDKITNWNDNDRRTWDDVVRRFTRTIERLQ